MNHGLVGAVAAALSLSAMPTVAEIIDFTATGATTGNNLDGSPVGTFDVAELADATTITISIPTFNGVFNATSNDSGIDRTNVSSGGGDDADRFDTGEEFSFSFSSAVSITEFNFSSIASGESFTLTAGTQVIGITSSNTSSSVYTPDSAIVLDANELITFDNIFGNFGLQTITLTVVPEPSSYAAMLGLGALLITRRRRG